MGALIAIHSLTEEDSTISIDGLILASPVVHIDGEMNFWQRMLARMVLLVYPSKRIRMDSFEDDERSQDPKVTRDPAYQAYLQNTPHQVESYTLRFIKTLFEWIESAPEAAKRLNTPILVLYAGKDIFVKPEKVESFFDQLSSEEKTLAPFPESYHLLLHDLDKSEVLNQIEAWLTQRI